MKPANLTANRTVFVVTIKHSNGKVETFRTISETVAAEAVNAWRRNGTDASYRVGS